MRNPQYEVTLNTINYVVGLGFRISIQIEISMSYQVAPNHAKLISKST